MDISILQQGNVYFFYRPKVEHDGAHNVDDVQRFYMVLKPLKKRHYIMLVIGRKVMPEKQGTYFSFVEKIASNLDELIKLLSHESYSTLTKGTREVEAARCVAEGKYIILNHENHTHLVYQLSTPYKMGAVQEAFNLKEQDDFIVNIKNPNKGNYHPTEIRAKFPEKLQENFKDYNFIPLSSAEYLNYEGAELLLVAKSKEDIEEEIPELKKCISEIKEEDILERLKQIEDEKVVMPAMQKEWS